MSDKTPHNEGITVKKSEDFSAWYIQVVTKARMIEYYDVSGCYIILPDSYFMWEQIQIFLDYEFKNRNVENTYFPIFITKSNMEKEKTHIKDFKPEVAWVTKSGEKDLQEELAIRPTSECSMYSIFPRLIRTSQDLPLKFNQWCNVVRWEFRDPTPFIRSREFLWNEGHTCYDNESDSLSEVLDIINLYSETYRKILSVPTIMGIKTDNEKFAGANATYTIEGFIPESGRGIQCATAHSLGQNFSKIFDIKYINSQGKHEYVYQNSWGFTTRSIGVMLMIHGDDKGPVIPAIIAKTQAVVIPIFFKKSENEVKCYLKDLEIELKKNGIRYKVDLTEHNPGWKYNFWETKGIPLRIEIGPRDAKNKTVTVVQRHNGLKSVVDLNALDEYLNKTMECMAEELYKIAKERMNNCISRPKTSAEFVDSINDKKMCLVRWCGNSECENKIKECTGAKSLCQPLETEYKILDGDCAYCGEEGVTTCLFGKSY